MPEPTLDEALVTLIKNEANNNPAPTKCRITKIYNGNTHCDCETNIGTLQYIETIGTPLLNKTGVVIYLDGDINQPIIIC